MMIALPCFAANAASWACCAASSASSLCCSLASCFGCKYNAKLAKLTYLFIYFVSAVLGIFLRYYGKQALSGWVTQMANVCDKEQCWGMQAAYRISFSVAVFFAIMVFFTCLAPITHLGGWLVKIFLYAVILGLSVLAQNDSMVQYAEAARVFSVVFLLAQVLIIIDFAYNAHEFLVRKIGEAAADMEARSFEPGLCSNGWANLYVLACLVLQVAGLTGVGFMFYYFGQCPLNNFFVAETLVIGAVVSVLSMMNLAGRGLLPPSIIFAYNTYLCYGAITNNPNEQCNVLARSENQSQASIIAGLAIAAFSVTWMAYSSAGSMYSAVAMGNSSAATDGVAATPTLNPASPAAGKGPGVTDWPPGGKPKTNGHEEAGVAAAYQREEDDEDEEAGRRTASRTAAAAHAHAEEPEPVEQRPYVFHVVMCLAGMYLAMLLTNWGQPSDSTGPSSNPELSVASMWARIGSQWAIHALFVWTLVAPACCPNRSFGR